MSAMQDVAAQRSKLVGICLLAFLISAGVRLLEAPRWDTQAYRLDGDFLLATHDAYAWVSGAEWDGAFTAGSPMALLLAALAGAAGVGSANLAFWLPAALAALSAIPIALWAVHLGASAGAALAAGVFGSLAPAFYTRTRLGYFDTDWALLFFPLLVSLLVAIWAQPYLRRSGPEALPRRPEGDALRRSLALLVVIPIGLIWHGTLPTFILSILCLAVVLVLLMGEGRVRGEAFCTLIALSLAVGAGWVGAVAGSVLLLLCSRLPSVSLNSARGQRVALAFLVVLLVTLVGAQFQDYLVVRMARYFGEAGGGAGGLVYPDIGASVRETRTVHWMASLQGAAFFWWLGVAGMLGFVYLSVKRPVALLLAPMLVLGLLSPRLGVRFAMFAGPILVLGVIVPLDGWLASWPPARRRGIPASAVIFGAMLLVGVALVQRGVARLPIEPVVNPQHAAALRSLRSRAGAGGLIWTWWDYGYASEYFARLPVFANGGRNSGEYLFTLGRVLGSDDLRVSAQMMGLSAALGGTPWEVWDAWGTEALDAWLDRMPEAAREANASIPQFLVVQWEAIALLPWIQYYGSWDFTDGVGKSSEVLQFSQPLELDLENGRFTERGGRTFALSSADLVSQSESRHEDFPQNVGGLHLIMRMDSYATFLLDDRAYRSALVTLLLAPERSFGATAPFELLIDGAPNVRVLRLR